MRTTYKRHSDPSDRFGWSGPGIRECRDTWMARTSDLTGWSISAVTEAHRYQERPFSDHYHAVWRHARRVVSPNPGTCRDNGQLAARPGMPTAMKAAPSATCCPPYRPRLRIPAPRRLPGSKILGADRRRLRLCGDHETPSSTDSPCGPACHPGARLARSLILPPSISPRLLRVKTKKSSRYDVASGKILLDLPRTGSLIGMVCDAGTIHD
jgi:hypothetical protein